MNDLSDMELVGRPPERQLPDHYEAPRVAMEDEIRVDGVC
jgi:hypothetical protein